MGLKEIDITAKPADSYTDTVLVVGQIARQAVTAGQLITSDDHQRHRIDQAARRARRQGGHVDQGGPGQRRRHDRQGGRLRGCHRGLQHRAHLRRPGRPASPRPSRSTPARRSRRCSRACRSWARCCPRRRRPRQPRAERLSHHRQLRQLHQPQRPGADRDPRGDAPAGRGPQLLADQGPDSAQRHHAGAAQQQGLRGRARRALDPAGRGHDGRHPPHPRRAVRGPAALRGHAPAADAEPDRSPSVRSPSHSGRPAAIGR